MNVSWLHRNVTDRKNDAKALKWVARIVVLVIASLLVPILLLLLIASPASGWGILLILVGLIVVFASLIFGLPMALAGLFYLKATRRADLRSRLALGAVVGLVSGVAGVLVLASGSAEGGLAALRPNIGFLYVAIGGATCGVLVAMVYHASTLLMERWTKNTGP